LRQRLAADGRGRTLHLRTGLAGGKAAAVEVPYLLAFVLAQMCLAHVQFHLPVKLRGLPRLGRSTAWRGALQN
jgi:hypothetical protein